MQNGDGVVSALKPEERLQIHIVRRLRDILPRDCEFRAVEQGVFLHGSPTQRMAAWQKLLNKGVKAGTTDLHFWWQGKYLTIELKAGKNTVTDAEAAFMNAIIAAGFYAAAAWSAQQVENILRLYRFPLSGTMAGIDERLAIEAPPRKAPKKPSGKPRAKPTTKAGLRAAAFAQRPPVR